jgi:hypothetical protein
MAIKYELIHKVLRQIEKKADAIGFDIDNCVMYKDMHQLLANIEFDGYKPTTAERKQLGADLATMCEGVGLSYSALIKVLF